LRCSSGIGSRARRSSQRTSFRYLGIGRAQAGHIRVNHSAEEFARDDERTGLRARVNTAESLHALLKRAIVGVWHWISDSAYVRPKVLQAR
jgi:hypothetical protein